MSSRIEQNYKYLPRCPYDSGNQDEAAKKLEEFRERAVEEQEDAAIDEEQDDSLKKIRELEEKEQALHAAESQRINQERM